MKKLYERFVEIAEDFTGGESRTHFFSDHTHDDCIVWQEAIQEFAKFLDENLEPKMVKKRFK